MKISVRQIIEKFLNQKYGRYIELVSSLISLFSCIIWLVQSYVGHKLEWFESVDIAFLIYYLLEYTLRLYTAQNRLNFLFSYWSLIDLATLVPLILIENQNDSITIRQFIEISRIIRILRVVRLLNRIFKIDEGDLSSVSRQIYTIFLTILTLVFVTSGVILTFETPKRKELIQQSIQNKCKQSYNQASFHEMIYFVVVTLATVGYGDVIPYSEQGRVCVIIFIVIVLVLLPKQTNELIRLLGM